MDAKKLLVIDDEPAITALIKRIAESCGYAVVATSDAKEFKSMASGKEDDVICLDLAMPHFDGVEILGFLAEIKCRSKLLIISGFDPGIVSSALKLAEIKGLNAAGTIPKPIKVAELRSLLLTLKQDI